MMALHDEITHLYTPVRRRTASADEHGLMLWFGAHGSRIAPGTSMRHWLVRSPHDGPVGTLVQAGFDAVFDELDIPVPGVGVVRCTMRPNAPGEPVDFILHGLGPTTAANAISVRAYDGVVHAEAVWERLRRLKRGLKAAL